MAKDGPTEIYMIKKSAEGFIVSFRLGTDQGVTPGMDMVVLNEDGFQVGHVTVLSSTENRIRSPGRGRERNRTGLPGQTAGCGHASLSASKDCSCHLFRKRPHPHRAVLSAFVSPHGSRI